jgi:hypothetical protein
MTSQLLLLLLLTSAIAQEPKYKPATKPVNCESDIAMLDLASNEAGVKGLIIIIARLGDGDRNVALNRRRLHNVRVYLTEWDGRRDPATVVTAAGKRVKGYGRIEIYIGGKLFSVILIRPNADLIVGSCTYEINTPAEQRRENNLYPWLDRVSTEIAREARFLNGRRTNRCTRAPTSRDVSHHNWSVPTGRD